MAISLDQFTQQLADSGLMSSDDIASVVAGLRASSKPLDGEALARQLVRQKKLTAYQAQEIYSRRGKSLVLGNYVILDKLGQGGMGLVLKAEHRRMKRLVALKVLSPKVVRTPESLRRFQREVEAAARLTHPNIVVAHDADEAGGTHFLVMAYVEGTDLLTLVKQQGPLPLDQALDCILQAARGLQYAHEHGVVHRDIKPANLVLDRQGTVKILDMGLARLDSAGAQQDQLTGTGQIMGTVDYMAPEQALDTKRADGRADIYSLGVTLWYLLTGQSLYAGETVVEKLMAHQTKPIPTLSSVRLEVSPPLEAVFRRMVAKTPGDRYQTIAELIADVEPLRGSMAAAATVGAAVVEDVKWDEFLGALGPSAASHRPGPALSGSSRAAALATKTAPAPVAEPDETLTWSKPQVATDPQMEQSLARPEPAKAGTNVRSMALQSRAASRVSRHGGVVQARLWRVMLRGDGWQDWRKLTAAGAGGLLLVLLGIWVIVRDKGGREVARVPVPEGGNVTVETASEAAGPGTSSPRPVAGNSPGTSSPRSVAGNSPGTSSPRSVAGNSAGTSSPRPGTPGRGVGGEGSGPLVNPAAPWKLPPGSPPPANAPFDAVQAKSHQATWAKHLGVPVEMTNSIGMRFVLIPPGEFDMGSTAEEVARLLEDAKSRKVDQWYIDHLASEAPKHRVRITKPFYLGQCEVTQAEYERVIGSNPSQFKDDPTRPVERVNWDEAAVFCLKLGEQPQEQAADAGYRLPTEAEWEHACRAGTATTWLGTDDEAVLKEQAWFNANAEGKTHPVRQTAPNSWGLYDMHGNVWEWCQDWCGEGYYAASPLDDPTGASRGPDRVNRGGSWNFVASYCRAAFRNGFSPGNRDVILGFRLARTVSSLP
ncbi:MAG: SUMF1/EgtB/PvdO family nonheme iron enzyme [Planctomycetota bacterium]|nr:SUMF1/EgtB/PvdO family nonheme iron enzyme [Planctomycetota bacterium]